jgi:hypothetical protein
LERTGGKGKQTLTMYSNLLKWVKEEYLRNYVL